MADSKQGAYGARASDTDFRRKWDKEEYAERARQKDEEERLRMQENDERMKQGTADIRSLCSQRSVILTHWYLSTVR
jgi:U4/U6.U5 tri-snRNP component SNU23